jgi:hypothetical protein
MISLSYNNNNNKVTNIYNIIYIEGYYYLPLRIYICCFPVVTVTCNFFGSYTI